MKKTVLLSLFLLLGTGLAYAAVGKIEIAKPADQDKYTQDQTILINWSVKGQVPLYVDSIQLMDETGSNLVKSISGQTMNDGSYKWKIPLDLEPGNYRIKITSNVINAHAVSGIFTVLQKLTWEAPKYAMIAALKVNQESPSNSCTDPTQRVRILIQDGIQIWASATSIYTPIYYKYKVELTDPYTSHDYAIYDGNWVTQSILNINPTGDEVMDAVFPNGVGGPSIPVSFQGRVTVWVKNGAQTEPPKFKEICISFLL